MRKLKLTYLIILFSGIAQAQIPYAIEKAELSTDQYNEFGACYYKNEIVFCSNHKNKIINRDVTSSELPFINIYKTGVEDAKNKSVLFSKNFLGPFNIGPMNFNNDFTKIYFTKNSDVNTLGIFSAEQNNNEWTNIKPFEFNDPCYSVGHPSLNADGSKLFFISNMSGGLGGTDIYLCEKKADKWSAPVNLGSVINTSGNEMFPFIHPNGKLYFSSAGHNATGGLDIFYTELKEGKWINPIKLDQPINSDKDDFAYISDISDSKGYFSTDRKGSDDIYKFSITLPEFEKCDSLKKHSSCFVFYESAAIEIDTLPLVYEWDMGDGTKIRRLEADHCFKNPGTYQIKLNVIDTTTGDIFYSQADYEFVLEEIKQPYISAIDTGIAKQALAFNGTESNIPNYTDYSYYWEFGDGSRTGGENAEHVYPSQGKYTVKLGITAKDSMGKVNKFCTYKDIVVLNSLTSKPFVESKIDLPVKDSVKIKEPEDKNSGYKVEVYSSESQISVTDQRFENLLSEYEVVENYLKEDKKYSYTVGNEPTLTSLYPIYENVIKKGYTEAAVNVYKLEIITLEELEQLSGNNFKDKVIRFGNALFEKNSCDLSTTICNDLDKIYSLLQKDKAINVIITAHTDDIGSAEYNLQLSDKRANSIVNYLTAKGISKKRCLAKGCGKSKPIASNITEEGRRQNRRVEISLNKKEK